eukprot:EG_transcript_50507
MRTLLSKGPPSASSFILASPFPPPHIPPDQHPLAASLNPSFTVWRLKAPPIALLCWTPVTLASDDAGVPLQPPHQHLHNQGGDGCVELSAAIHSPQLRDSL